MDNNVNKNGRVYSKQLLQDQLNLSKKFAARLNIPIQYINPYHTTAQFKIKRVTFFDYYKDTINTYIDNHYDISFDKYLYPDIIYKKKQQREDITNTTYYILKDNVFHFYVIDDIEKTIRDGKIKVSYHKKEKNKFNVYYIEEFNFKTVDASFIINEFIRIYEKEKCDIYTDFFRKISGGHFGFKITKEKAPIFKLNKVKPMPLDLSKLPNYFKSKNKNWFSKILGKIKITDKI